MRKVNRIVQTTEGPVRGMACGNPWFTVFRGVPYAAPPVGKLRWHDPVPPEKREGILDCFLFSPKAPQALYKVTNAGDIVPRAEDKEHDYVEIPESEDCLYLNIWTPDIEPDAQKAVFLWIHGGRYAVCCGSEPEIDGEAFCREDVVFVSVQYRLGPFGYLAHPQLAEESPLGATGTLGILDLIQALKWLHQNIANFGGNPDNITIGGQSAGGNLTNALIVSPLSRGLVRRACVHSTGIFWDHDPHYSREKGMQIGEAVCAKLGRTIDELREIPTKEVHKMIMDAANSIGEVEFMPIIDGVVFQEQVYESLAKGDHDEVDIMVGSVSGDGVIGKFRPMLVEGFAGLAKEFGGEKAEDIIRLFRADKPENMPEAYIMARQVFPRTQPLSWAMAEDRNGKKSLYVYYFDRALPGDDAGAYHSGELWYVFGSLDHCWRSMKHYFTGADYMLSQTMTRYWCNFIKSGNPNEGDLNLWEPYTDENPAVMYFDENGASERILQRNDPGYIVCDIFADHRMGKF